MREGAGADEVHSWGAWGDECGNSWVEERGAGDKFVGGAG